MKVARAKGASGFTAEVFAVNRPMLHVFRKSGCEMKSSLAEGVHHLEFRFETERRRAAQAA